MNFKCFFGFHKWSEWEKPFMIGWEYERSFTANYFGPMYMQLRHCDNCGGHQEQKRSERSLKAEKDYEFIKFNLKKSQYFADKGDFDKANWYLKIAEHIGRS